MLEWYYFAIGSGILMAIAVILERHQLRVERAHSYSTAIAMVCGLLSIPLLPFVDYGIGAGGWALLILLGGFQAASNWFAARMFRHGGISVTTPLTTTLPIIFIVIFAFLLLGETLQPIQYIAILVLVAATYLMLTEAKSSVTQDYLKKYGHLAIITSIFIACVGLTLKEALLTIDPLTVFAISNIVMATSMVFAMYSQYNGLEDVKSDAKKYAKPVIVIGALVYMYWLAYLLAVSLAAVAIVTPVRYSIYVVFGVIGGGLLYKEPNLKKKILLSVIMLVMAALLL